MADKQRQHYVPKFYLRNFSYYNEQKHIGVFNTITEFFIQKGALKTQCYKSFFYGRDGEIENFLSDLEGGAAPLIKKMLSSEYIPSKGSYEYKLLLLFILLTEIRNPIASKNIRESRTHLQDRLNELEEIKNSEVLSEIPKISHEESIKIAFSTLNASYSICQDLGYKLIVNSGKFPFITSDNPVITYNQYLEQKKAVRGKTGYASIGIQVFLPISPDKIIIFYDKETYKVGGKKKNYIQLTEDIDIEQLNILQFLNCDSNIYFDHRIDEAYLNTLKRKAQLYTKGNLAKSQIIEGFNSKGEKIEGGSLIYLSASSIDINLSISGITQTKKVKSLNFDAAELNIRPKVKNILNSIY